MKKIITGIFFILSLAYIQAQTPDSQLFKIKEEQYFGRNPEGEAMIKFSSGNRVEMWNEDYFYNKGVIKNRKSGTYILSNVGGIDYITISWSAGTQSTSVQEKFLFLLHNDWEDIYMYKSDSGPYFERLFGNNAYFGNGSWVTASSFLKETLGGKIVTYSPDKLGLQSDINPSDTNTFQIEILEVYPGTKYPDVCLNAICYNWAAH